MYTTYYVGSVAGIHQRLVVGVRLTLDLAMRSAATTGGTPAPHQPVGTVSGVAGFNIGVDGVHRFHGDAVVG